MKRRELLIGVGACSAFVFSGERLGAQALRKARMGWLSGGLSGLEGNPLEAALKPSLEELGWKLGDTLEISERHAGGDFAGIPRLAAELVALRPDVIGATGTTEAKALQNATRQIPVVFMQVAADPVAAGLVESINRPGGNITGFMQSPQPLWGKRLDLLTELLGGPPRRIGFLSNPENVTFPSSWLDARQSAEKLGAWIERGDITAPAHLDAAFQAFEGCDAVLVAFDFLIVGLRSQIVERTTASRLPAIYEQRRHVVAGGLMSYGPDLTENFRQGATYISRILKGAHPGDLPVIQGSRFEFVINPKTAKAVLARADEVIE